MSSSPTCARTRSTRSTWSRRARWTGIPASSTAASAGTGCGDPTGTGRPTTSAPSGPDRAFRSSWPIREGVPLNARGGIGDHISGLAALAGLLAAVLEQRHTGRGPRRRGVAPADRDLRPRLGPEPPGHLGQGRTGRGAPLEPDAAHELLPDRRRPLVLLHGLGSGPAHRQCVPGPRPPGSALGPSLRRCDRHPPQPHRGHRRAGRGHRGAVPRRLGRALRPRRCVVGPGARAGGRPRGSAAGGERRLPLQRGTRPAARPGARSTVRSASRISRCGRRRPRPSSGSTPTRCSPNWPGDARQRGTVSPEPGPGPAGPGR